MNVDKGYDPLKRTEKLKKFITSDLSKKYFRFRPSRFYGGIATADCVGCNLICKFCSNFFRNTNYKNFGKFYKPDLVAINLLKIANKKNFSQLRITGGEPTIHIEHLFKLLEIIPDKFQFILETNGILLGANEDYVKELAKFKNLYVRVSLKGANEEEFHRLTGAKAKFFNYQLQSLEYLAKYKIPSHPAIMSAFSDRKNIRKLRKLLKTISKRYSDLEEEEFCDYGDAYNRVLKYGLIPKEVYRPEDISD